MNDIINQIEEAQDNLNSVKALTADTVCTITYTIKVLKRMAAGEDWFDIESAPKDDTAITLWPENGYWSEESKARWVSWSEYHQCEVPLLEEPTHWKHVDQSKHIKMLIKEAMKDDK